MNVSSVDLPTNRSFGFFFVLVFLASSAYFYHVDNVYLLCFFAFLGGVFFILSIVNAEILLPLNKLWMKFGLLLGRIVSPIVMGGIFFGIFTPLAILMRFFGRDELRLKFKKQASYWVVRDEVTNNNSFKNQF